MLKYYNKNLVKYNKLIFFEPFVNKNYIDNIWFLNSSDLKFGNKMIKGLRKNYWFVPLTGNSDCIIFNNYICSNKYFVLNYNIKFNVNIICILCTYHIINIINIIISLLYKLLLSIILYKNETKIDKSIC